MIHTVIYEDPSRYKELERRVRDALKDLPSHKGNVKLYVKAGILLTLYGGLYSIPFFFAVPFWFMIFGGIFQGIVMASIGMNIMHDAGHGSFFKNPKANKLLSKSANTVGADEDIWNMQHNLIHHIYTNIFGFDDDANGNGLIRLNPYEEWRKMHRFQHYYAWFLYSLMTIYWCTAKDFFQAVRYHREGRQGFENLRKIRFSIGVKKFLYFSCWILIPVLFWKVSWWVPIVSFLVMHLSAGLLLGIVFQPAHISSLTVFKKAPPFQSRVEHQIVTSCNYAMNNKFITELTGGLNFQIEHHLFPYISHVHYPRIAPVVQKYCGKHKINYNNLGSFWDALRNHCKTLKGLGKKPEMVAA